MFTMEVFGKSLGISITCHFCHIKNNYGLLLNIDWLQPFKHVTYSVGVMYLVFLNLPRSVSFKQEKCNIVWSYSRTSGALTEGI